MRWLGRGTQGQGLPSGTYFCRLRLEVGGEPALEKTLRATLIH